MPARPAMPLRRVRGAAVLLTLGLALTSCGDDDGPETSAAPGGEGRGCISDFDPDKDYFPVKSRVEHAKNFTLRYEKSYQVLTVKEPYPKGGPESYVLVKCGAPKPKLTGALKKAQQVTTPVRSLYSGSTTHLPLLTETGTTDVLTGVADGAFVTSSEVRERIKAGKVTEYAENNEIATEKVIAKQPDVLMTAGTDDPQYPKLRRAGVAVVANAEWKETTPLGRAEWVKAMAALTGAEKRAGQVFETVESGYGKTAARAAEAGEETEVLPGSMYQGTWNMSPGDSHAARLIADAGGTYPWADTEGTDNLPLSFETVFGKGGDAKTWLADQPWKTTADAVKADRRYGKLAAVRDGRVWSGTKSMGPGGGNDLYERGVMRPDLVLADLFAILHPDEAPKDHAFTFYRKVPRA